MTKQVQRRRGTASQHTSFTGADGELSVNTTNKSVHVHDGVTTGGIEAARADLGNVSSASVLGAAGITATTAELNYTDGVTSSIQTQLNTKAPINNATFTGTTVVPTADINGGTIDGTVIGGSTPAAISGTTGQFGTSLNVDGTVTADGLTVDSGSASSNIFLRNSGTSYLNLYSDDNGVAILDVDGNNTGAAPRFQIDVGDKQTFRIASNGDISFYEDTGTTPKFFWDASTERLGIGNSSPATALDVTGTVTADGLTVDGTATVTGTSITIKNNASFLKFENAFATRTGYIQSRADAFDVWNDQATPMVFGTSNTERMRIDSSGRVGIGTSSPSYPLTVDGYIGVRSGNGITFLNPSNNYTSDIYNGASSGTSDLRFKTQATERMCIDASGNVGIGTSSPIYKLDIATSGTSGGRITTAEYGQFVVTDGLRSVYLQNYVGVGSLGTSSNNPLMFAVNNSERMRIDSSGNVLVGTTNNPTSARIISDAGTGAVSASFYATNPTYGITTTYNYGGTRIGEIGSHGSISSGASLTDFAINSPFNLVFNTGYAERMRIDSSGNLLVGTNTATGVAGGTTVGTVIEDTGVLLVGGTSVTSYFNRQGSDGDITVFRKDGTTVGSIGSVASTNLVIGSGATGLRFFSSGSAIQPRNTNGDANNDTIDLGLSTNRFKDLYLSGGVYLGGTGSANKLDDYEEGTWTPTAVCSGQTPAYSSQQGTYTKIGNVVRAQCVLNITSVSGSAGGNTTITGLPFAGEGTEYTGQGIIGYNDGFANTVSATWISSTTAFFRAGARSSGNDAGGFAVGYINIEWIYIT